MEEQADIGLIAACQQGDPGAFRRIFEIYRDRVYGMCRQMSGNDQDAEDLTQEIFVWVFENIRAFRAESAFGTWLYRIAANRCLSELRKKRSRSAGDMPPANVVPLSSEDDIEKQMVRDELLARVETAIAALPENQRLIFVMGTQMGMRYREIGKVLGCSEEAVKMRIHRARRRVRDTVRPYLEEDG